MASQPTNPARLPAATRLRLAAGRTATAATGLLLSTLGIPLMQPVSLFMDGVVMGTGTYLSQGHEFLPLARGRPWPRRVTVAPEILHGLELRGKLLRRILVGHLRMASFIE
jgi:hypothetical protein